MFRMTSDVDLALEINAQDWPACTGPCRPCSRTNDSGRSEPVVTNRRIAAMIRPVRPGASSLKASDASRLAMTLRATRVQRGMPPVSGRQKGVACLEGCFQNRIATEERRSAWGGGHLAAARASQTQVTEQRLGSPMNTDKARGSHKEEM
jgi:hypothetical protein